MMLFLNMNYLAHAFLSFNNRDILAGNIISDCVKGKAQYSYPEAIRKGIRLHRLIDEYTDRHPVTARAKTFFRPQYRLYSGAFIDIVYDHFLALDAAQFGQYGNLKNFSTVAYQQLELNITLLPFTFQKMFIYMKTQDWLYNYQFKEGIRRSFNGIVSRSLYLKESDIAFEIFNKYYTELNNCYAEFFPGLKQFAFENMSKLLCN
jgi:acyl carrier protein phosphodiesterase